MVPKYSYTITIIYAILFSAFLLTGCKAKSNSQPTTEIAGGPAAAASATIPARTDTLPAATQAAGTATPAPSLAAPTETGTAPSPPATSAPQGSPTPEPGANPTPTSTEEPAAEPTGTGETTATTPPETPPAEGAAACTDVAAFYKDVTVEDYSFFGQSEPFVKTWQIRNAGTCSWGSDYTVNFDSGFTFDAPQSSPLAQAAPGQIVEVSLDMIAPARGGQYISRWRFKNANGSVFGVGLENGQLFTVINVGFISPTSAATQPTTQPSGGGSQATPVPGSSGSCSYSLDQSFAQQLVEIINQARQQAGLNRLDIQSQLAAAAQEHSIDIACHDSYDHIGSDGSLWAERVGRQGYANSNSARENIRVGDPAFGFSPQYVFDRWFESQIHHDNMYYPTVEEIGISCVINPKSEYKEFCTAVFARP